MRKRHLNRGVATILCLCLLFTTVAGAINVTLKEDTDTNYLKYIAGFQDRTVRPDTVLTRAQGAKMLSYVLDLDQNTKETSFTDVSRDFWGYDAISTLSGAGIMNGYAGNTFKPNQGLTRAEFAAILSRIVSPSNAKKAAELTDVRGHWAEKEILALSDLGYVGGYADKTFRPNRYLTRAEAVKLINHAVKIKSNPKENRELFDDLPKTHWAYYEMMAAASTTALETTIPRGTTKFEDIQYIDLEPSKITERANNLLNEFPAASVERQAEIYNELTKLQSDVATAATMTRINMARDVTNPKYKKDANNIPSASNALTKILQKRYDLVQRSKNVEKLSSLLGINLHELEKPQEAMPDELLKLLTEEQTLINQFNEFYYASCITYMGKEYSLSQAESSSDATLKTLAYDYYLKNYKVLGGIFDQIVNVRTKLAKIFGFDNYSEVGYIISGKTTFTSKDIEVFRKDVKKYIMPLFNNLLNAQINQNNGYEFPDYKKIKDDKNALENCISTIKNISPQTKQTLNHMLKYNMFDLNVRPNKDTGAFSTYIDNLSTPFVFMNSSSGYDDVETFSHEFGHAFQYFRIPQINKDLMNHISSDLAEIASYGMEVLTSSKFDELFGENGDTAEKFMLFKDLSIVVSTVFLDEFQHIIYKNPKMTIEQRNEAYIKLWHEYYGDSALKHEALAKGIVWSNPGHIFERPYYAVDYALALTAAMQVWKIAQTDFDAAFETYMDLIESPYMTYGIDAVCKTAGLTSPFENNSLKTLSELLEKEFKQDNKTELKRAS